MAIVTSTLQASGSRGPAKKKFAVPPGKVACFACILAFSSKLYSRKLSTDTMSSQASSALHCSTEGRGCSYKPSKQGCFPVSKAKAAQEQAQEEQDKMLVNVDVDFHANLLFCSWIDSLVQKHVFIHRPWSGTRMDYIFSRTAISISTVFSTINLMIRETLYIRITNATAA